MGKRIGAFYPTDPRAVEALVRFFNRMGWSRGGELWLDPAAGYGGLLEKFVPRQQRVAIEIEPRFEPLLNSRVPDVTIGDGLDTTLWPARANLITNPPYDHKLATAFADTMLDVSRAQRPWTWVVLLVLTTWSRSKSARRLFSQYGDPDWVVGHTFRLKCDGTDRGDSRTHDWLIWAPPQYRDTSRTCYTLLDEPELPRSEVALHRLMARQVEELFADEMDTP